VTLEDRIIKTIEANLEQKARIAPDTNLRQDLGLDSFAMVIVINALEDEFSITINDQEFRGINNVVDIADALKRHYPEIKEQYEKN
jgi:acyl carrier protein